MCLAWRTELADEDGFVELAGDFHRQGEPLVVIFIGVQADGGDIEFTPPGPFVQGLNVLQDMLEPIILGGDEFLGQRIKLLGVEQA